MVLQFDLGAAGGTGKFYLQPVLDVYVLLTQTRVVWEKGPSGEHYLLSRLACGPFSFDLEFGQHLVGVQ